MKNLYKVNITIFNDFGELVDTQLSFGTLDEMDLALTNPDKMHKLVEEAREYATQENLLTEELYDGSSREDLINSDEIFEKFN